MNRRSISLLLIVALALCGATAQAVEFFDEDFSAGVLPASLELSDKYVAPLQVEVNPGGDLVDLTGGNVTYYEGEFNRQYIRTVDSDYANYDFTCEATVTTTGLSNWSIAYLGMGPTGIDELNSGEPQSYPRLDANVWNSIDSLYLRDGAVFSGVGNVPVSDGTHRLRMTWDAATQQAEFAIDVDYAGGAFEFDYAIARDGSDNGFDVTNSNLHFGGGNGLVFDDVSVSIAPDKTIDSTNVALGKPVIYTSNEYSVAYPGTRVTDGRNEDADEIGGEYWITDDSGVNNAYFIVDLEEAVDIAQINLLNTHNDDAYDRGTRDFEIFASNAIHPAGKDLLGGVSILSGELRNPLQSVPGEVFNAENGLAGGSYRYLKFVAKDYYVRVLHISGRICYS